MRQGTSAVRASGAREGAALEMIARHEGELRSTALRYSIDAGDAEDAYQRALEIVLTKAPTTTPDELLPWTKTVVKHEALALRNGRERLLGRRRGGGREAQDPLAAVPSRSDPPDEQAERRERVAQSREALQALKPDELRALGLLAEGYSYSEIGQITGFSQTKVNRVLAEGRARFRGLIARSEDGQRCRDLRRLLSAFCDGEVSQREATTVREHLRACASCRATMRTYRDVPRAAALLPLLPSSRSLLSRLHELAANLTARLPGAGGDATATQVAAAGGGRGLGAAALAKLLAVCAGAAGGAACVATGVVPAPTLVSAPEKPAIERPASGEEATTEAPTVEYDPLPPEPTATPKRKEPRLESEDGSSETASIEAEPSATSVGAVEYEPAPEPAPPPSPSPSGSAAGEFGP